MADAVIRPGVNSSAKLLTLEERDDDEYDPWILAQDDEKQYIDNGRSQVEMQSISNSHYVQPSGEEKSPKSEVFYKVEDVPPWYLCLIFGLQHYLTMFGGTISYPFLLTPKMCMRPEDPAKGMIISTTFFVSGIVTLIQATFGVRLPIVQGSTFSFLIPTLAILSLPQWQCPTEDQIKASRTYGSMIEGNFTFSADNSSASDSPVTELEWKNLWQVRMLEIQGAVIVASLFEVFIGFTGLIGYVLRWITPIGIAPIITLIGLSLFEDAARAAGHNWPIAIMTMLMLIIFSEYLKDFDVPRPTFTRGIGFGYKKFPLFKLFPVLLTIIISWFICAILTVANVFEPGDLARTDVRLETLHNSPWFRIPYPGQWGLPTVSAGAVLGIMAGVLSSAIESVGDYYACARMAGAPPPPTHAINRGIFFEGIGCVLSGIWGSGNGLTSYSENIGAIGVTKVGSRRVIQYGALLMIFFGTMGKFGGLFVTMPDPILGGIFCIMFAVITGVGLSNLQFIDLNSSRNLFIIGISIFMGLMIPKYMKSHPGAIDTGSPLFDQTLTVLLTTSLFVGGLIGILMDNTMPGTEEERGVKKWRVEEKSCPLSSERAKSKCYDIPWGMGFIRRVQIFRYFPISPTFDEELVGKKIKLLTSKVVPWYKPKEDSPTQNATNESKA